MNNLYEKDSALNLPIECFMFDARKEQFPVKQHWHYFMEIIYMVEGSARMTSDESEYNVKAGELIIFAPSALHAISAIDDFPLKYAVIKFDIGTFPSISSYVASPMAIFRLAKEKKMPIHFLASQVREMECENIFYNCIQESKRDQFGYDVMLRAQVYRLIYLIMREWNRQGFSVTEFSDQSEKGREFETVTEYIDTHLTEHIKVQDIAKQYHLSYSAFAVKFRTHYGMTCKEYIEKMRLYKAEEYLLFTDQDILTIAQKTGFTDCSHFIHSFKKHRHITPKQFRSKRKK